MRISTGLLAVTALTCCASEDPCDVLDVQLIALLQLEGAARSVVAVPEVGDDIDCTSQLPWTGGYACNSAFEGRYRITVEPRSGEACTSPAYDHQICEDALGCPYSTWRRLSLTSSTCTWQVLERAPTCD